MGKGSTENAVSVTDLGLTDRQAFAVCACYGDGHSTATVAEWLGVTAQAVKQLLTRARVTLARRGYPMPREIVGGGRAAIREALPGVCNS